MIPEITEAEWEALAKNWPPVVEREDGSLLIISGKWSEGKRTYDYATLEVSGQTPGTVGPEVARTVASARGKDVEEFRSDAEPTLTARAIGRRPSSLASRSGGSRRGCLPASNADKRIRRPGTSGMGVPKFTFMGAPPADPLIGPKAKRFSGITQIC